MLSSHESIRNSEKLRIGEVQLRGEKLHSSLPQTQGRNGTQNKSIISRVSAEVEPTRDTKYTKQALSPRISFVYRCALVVHDLEPVSQLRMTSLEVQQLTAYLNTSGSVPVLRRGTNSGCIAFKEPRPVAGPRDKYAKLFPMLLLVCVGRSSADFVAGTVVEEI